MIKETLIKARALISEPSCWTQGQFARNMGRAAVSPGDQYAVCWCAVGALRKVSASALVGGLARDLMPESPFPESDLVKFNDSKTHEEVLSLFDRAIERAS